MFEVDPRLKFSGEHDPADCIFLGKKGDQSAFFWGGGALPFWGSKFVFQYPVAIMLILVCIYMFTAMTNRLQLFTKSKMTAVCPNIQNGGQTNTF